MPKIYVLDACAIIASLKNENGADNVENIFVSQKKSKDIIIMHKINLLEVYYDVVKRCGEATAKNVLAEIKKNPIKIISQFSNSIFFEAGKLKAKYKISLADSIALSMAYLQKGVLVTSDHHEFDIIEQKEKISFYWIR
jgi:PIN domain nuclease of toxin-antitoxin system